VSHQQNVAGNSELLSANISFENVANFKHSGITVTNENFIHESIRED
jgi:hypothetical protein